MKDETVRLQLAYNTIWQKHYANARRRQDEHAETERRL